MGPVHAGDHEVFNLKLASGEFQKQFSQLADNLVIWKAKKVCVQTQIMP